jgi:hypothetical protein
MATAAKFILPIPKFLGVEQIQSGGRSYENQGAKNVKLTPNFTKFCSNVSCHMQICKQRY